jgi:5,10-methylenetetrahydromethanopterin reductase
MYYALTLDHRDWARGPVSRTIELARRADEAGIGSLWLNEDPEGWDAFAVLGALATQTERIRLGTGVTNAYHRHPNLMAASVATIDRLSSGRAFLGIGRGQPEWYARALGIPKYPPLALLDEAISLLRTWWSDEPRASAKGPIEINEWERAIRPVGMPPVYVAAVGPKALDLAARVADGVLFNELASIPYLTRAIRRVKTAAEAAGRDPGALRFFVNPAIAVTDDPLPVLRRKQALIATVHVLPGMDALLESPDFDIPAIVERVRREMKIEENLASGAGFIAMRRQGDLDAARKEIPVELVDQLAAIGPLEKVRARIQTYREIGATDLFLDRTALPGTAGEIRDLLARFDAP